MRVFRPVLSLAFLSAVFAFLLAASTQTAFAQAGVVLPDDAQQPDPTRLALDEMSVDVRVDQQFARVRIVQIYGNRTDRVMEGKYVFNIPTTASISDFAVWDGDVRIPGVMLEVKRAKEIYEQLKQQSIDPGLVTQEDENGGATAFTVKLVPIPAYGTKRVELEYTEPLPVEGLRSFFSLPLKPSEYGTQSVGTFTVNLDLSNRFPITDFTQRDGTFPLQYSTRETNHIVGSFTANKVVLAQDFAFDYTLNVARSELNLIAYRSPERISPVELRDPNRVKPDNDGYFEASALFNERGAQAAQFQQMGASKRSVVLLLDTSLSMRFEKLDRAYEACELFLRSLKPDDSFNVALFNDDVNAFAPSPQSGSPENVNRALEFIKQSYLSGGTDFSLALKRGLELAKQLPGDEKTIVLLTDGNPTLTTTQAGKLAKDFAAANKQGNANLARAYVFGIGSDANQNFLREIARVSRGYFDFGRETDELAFRLNAFFAKVGEKPVEGMTFAANDASNIYNVYPDIDSTSYDGSRAFFVGRYRNPAKGVNFTLTGSRAGKGVQLSTSADLPELDATHAHLPRVWARERINSLLRRIALEGEDEALIAEIIALSKKYNILTPYTAFLAAPRALLRPRVIKPGDPVLRVRTDDSIASVVAVFPFGLTKPLTKLENEDVWETRFLAPKEMNDGRYQCRLILTDTQGNVYQETKGFVIDSKPPQLTAKTSTAIGHAGETVEVTVAADRDTRRIAARLFGALPVRVAWDDKRKTNIGTLRIPPGLPSGKYTIIVTGEDFAHNVTSIEIPLEIVGG